MLGKRLLPLFVAAAIFLLQGADCVSFFFANQQAHDCCRKGQCSPKNPDPCCQVSPNTTVTQAQAKAKVQVLDLALLAVLPAWTHAVMTATVDSQSRDRLAFTSSPPGQLGNFSLPLLV